MHSVNFTTTAFHMPSTGQTRGDVLTFVKDTSPHPTAHAWISAARLLPAGAKPSEAQNTGNRTKVSAPLCGGPVKTGLHSVPAPPPHLSQPAESPRSWEGVGSPQDRGLQRKEEV